MTIWTFPAGVFPAQADWGLQSNTQTFTSPLDRTTQMISLPGARWKAKLQFSRLNARENAALTSLLARLRGQYGKFWLPNHGTPTPLGTGSGSPQVSGDGQTGVSLATAGWGAYETVLMDGDFFNVNGELKMAVADVDSDGSGAATIVFEPPLRSSPPGGSTIYTDHPTCIMRLATDDEFMSSALPGRQYSLSFSCLEVF